MQATNQKEARGFLETATYSWKTELFPTKFSGWGGTNATGLRRFREKPSVPVIKQEDTKKLQGY